MAVLVSSTHCQSWRATAEVAKSIAEGSKSPSGRSFGCVLGRGEAERVKPGLRDASGHSVGGVLVFTRTASNTTGDTCSND
jgi:hypothetical protein